MWCMFPGPKNGSIVVYTGLRPILAMLDSVMSDCAGGRLRKISFNDNLAKKPSREDIKQMKQGKDDHAKAKEGKNSPKDKYK